MATVYRILVEAQGNHQYRLVDGYMRTLAHLQLKLPLNIRVGSTGQDITLFNYSFARITRLLVDLDNAPSSSNP